jgi:MOSC domain-containing protein YiiM
MFEGRVVAIHISDSGSGPMKRVDQARAIEGQGLEGDRYFQKSGTFSKKNDPSREITFVEKEAIDALATDYDIELEDGATRRNVMTEGVPLNHLVGKEFVVGSIRVKGLRLCEPCGHLEELTGHPVKTALKHRGGLRAQILSGGLIKAGDRIAPAE